MPTPRPRPLVMAAPVFFTPWDVCSVSQGQDCSALIGKKMQVQAYVSCAFLEMASLSLLPWGLTAPFHYPRKSGHFSMSPRMRPLLSRSRACNDIPFLFVPEVIHSSLYIPWVTSSSPLGWARGVATPPLSLPPLILERLLLSQRNEL